MRYVYLDISNLYIFIEIYAVFRGLLRGPFSRGVLKILSAITSNNSTRREMAQA